MDHPAMKNLGPPITMMNADQAKRPPKEQSVWPAEDE